MLILVHQTGNKMKAWYILCYAFSFYLLFRSRPTDRKLKYLKIAYGAPYYVYF